MCGIIGYVGPRPCEEILVAGLEKLEYRGYDSAGMAILGPEGTGKVRAVGNLSHLREALNGVEIDSEPAAGGDYTGIAHTRWATHGRVTEENAHPHGDESGEVEVVLNGIIENYVELRREIEERGIPYRSETDAEVAAHLVSRYFDGDLTAAVRRAAEDMGGHFAFVAMHSSCPGVLVGYRKETPLIVGIGDGENFLASAIPAFMAETRRVIDLKDGETVTVGSGSVAITDPSGGRVEREPEQVTWDEEAAEKSGYETFMMKEIHEQPEAVAETVLDRITPEDTVDLSELGLEEGFLTDLRRVVIVACGTSYHAGLVGRYALERWARVPVEMDIASEYRYRDPVVGPGDLIIGITQSGETADTLAAMRLAREAGATVLAVTNIMGSQATRDSDAVLYTRAGLEIGVAATKTFVAQVAAMYLFALYLAGIKGTLETDRRADLARQLRASPELIQRAIDMTSDGVRAMAERHFEQEFFLYLGRDIGLPVCLEGALKLKEVSYVPTDAYAAGEMKHGPIALLDESTPVVCVATESPTLAKMLSNIEEVKARGADTIAVATEGDDRVEGIAAETIHVPQTDWVLQPLLAIIPLQLLAYHVARMRGLNVDQPRNLAKTVTVE